MGIEADAKYEATKAKFAALIEEGKSEMKNLEGFEAQRRHDYEIAKAQAYNALSNNNKHMYLSGETGESLINSLFDFEELGGKK